MTEKELFMKLVAAALTLFISFNISADDSVDLKWKINDGEIVTYKTKMSPFNDNTENSLTLDVDRIIESKKFDDKLKNQLSTLKFPNESKITTYLKGSKNNISVEMILNELKVPTIDNQDYQLQKKLNDQFQNMKGSVQLRGTINKNGTVESFYLEQKQKNLLAMFFELPSTKVSKGDEWSIGVNCLSMGSGYVNESAGRINKVHLSDIAHDPEKGNVAIIDYLIAEKISGTLHNPISNKTTPISMTCSYLGRHEFSIDKGRWLKANGEFAIHSKGFMNSNVKQQFALTLIDSLRTQ